MTATINISSEAFDPATLLKDFTASMTGAGAIASFTGLVRTDDNTTALSLSHYSEFTESVIASFTDQAMTRWPLLGYHIHHRVGDIQVEEPIVFVATASHHRRDAFAACDFLMDHLKSDAPFWKEELTGTHRQWVEPRKVDYTDKQRWSRK